MEDDQREQLIARIRPHVAALKKCALAVLMCLLLTSFLICVMQIYVWKAHYCEA